MSSLQGVHDPDSTRVCGEHSPAESHIRAIGSNNRHFAACGVAVSGLDSQSRLCAGEECYVTT